MNHFSLTVRNWLSRSLSIFFTFLFIALAVIKPVSAQQESAYRGLIIDKYRFDFGVVEPGAVLTESFTIKHDYEPTETGGVRDVTVSPEIRNTFQDGDKITYKDDLPFEASLANWIDVVEDSYYLVEQEQELEVFFTITVPENAEPGVKVATIFLTNYDGEAAIEELSSDEIGLGLNAALGVQVFLTVNGDLESNLGLEGLYTTNVKNKKTSFFFNPPVNVVATLRNKGNVSVVPRGRVIIHKGDDFVKGEIASFELNPTGKLILPGNTRAFTFTWDESPISTKAKIEGAETTYSTKYDLGKISKLRLGKYNVTLQYTYAQSDGTATQTFTGNTSFKVFPWQLLVLILLLVAMVVFYVYRKKRQGK